MNVTYTNLDSTVQPTTHLGYMVQPIAARLQTVQHVTVLNTVGNCNRMVITIILYCDQPRGLVVKVSAY